MCFCIVHMRNSPLRITTHNKGKRMISKPISKANASKLALMIGYKSIENDIKIVEQNYITLSEMVRPIHEKFVKEGMKQPPLWKLNTNLDRFGIRDEAIAKPTEVFDARGFTRDLVHETALRMNHQDRNNVDLFDHVIDGASGHTETVDLQVYDNVDAETLQPFEIGIEVASKYTTGDWRESSLKVTKDFHPNVPLLEDIHKRNEKFMRELRQNFCSLCKDLEEQILRAGKTKNLLEHWPECEPFVTRIWGAVSEKAIDKPLGNIILRHLKALPQAEA